MRRRVFGALLPATVGLLAVLILLAAHPTGRDLSVMNTGWNGLSRAAAALEATPLLSYDDLGNAAPSATLILIPRLPLTEGDLDAVDSFVSSGGTLVLLDDFSTGNDILSFLGCDIRFDGGVLRDPLYCYRNPVMPAVDVRSGGTEENTETVILDHATWLNGASGEQVRAWTSYFSYGDVDGDGVLGSGDISGPLPVAAVLGHGSGRVIIVADSSFLLNGVTERGANAQLLRQYAKDEVFIDQTHIADEGVDRGQDVLNSVGSMLGGGAGVIVLSLAVFGLSFGYAWYNRERHDNE